MERVLTLHKSVEHSRLIQPDRQVKLIYDLTRTKIKVVDTPKTNVDGYLDHLAFNEGENLKKKRIVKILNEIKDVTSWDIERDMISNFLESVSRREGSGDHDELRNRFTMDITWEEIEKLFTDLERTSGKSSMLGKILDIFNYEYFLDYLGNDVLQEKVFFDEELHIRYSNRASEFQTGRVIEVLIRGIKEQGTGRVMRKATVVTSFRA